MAPNYDSRPDSPTKARPSPVPIFHVNSSPSLPEKYIFSYPRSDTATTVTSGSDRPLPRLPGRGWRFYAALGCLCVVNLVCALDATSLAVALPVIAKKLHGSSIEASWAGTSFLLTETVSQPSFASLSHIFGRKPILLLALTFFTVGALIAALANSFTPMLVGRSIQGVGGGGIYALTYIIVTDMVTLKERGKWFGLITMMCAFGSVVGPVIGGALAEKVSWRWIFWLNIPFCALCFLTIPVTLKLKPKEGKIIKKIKQIDWIGSFLFIASTTSFLVPVTWGGVMYAWYHWRTLVPLTIGLFGFFIFILWSKYVASEPILRGSIFKDTTVVITYFCTVVHGMFLWSALYYMPLYFEAAKSFSPVTSGIALFPWTFTIGPSAAVVGVLIARVGRYRWAIWTGWLLAVVGINLLVLLKANTITATWVGISFISGLGVGILYPAMSYAIQAPASNRDLPFAAALYSFFRSFGQMLGLGVGGVVFQNEIKQRLLAYPDTAPYAAKLSKYASALVGVIKAMPPEMAKMKGELITAYVDSLRVLWVVMGVLAGAALAASLFTKGVSIERELETEQGFVDEVRPRDSLVDARARLGAQTSRSVLDFIRNRKGQ